MNEHPAQDLIDAIADEWMADIVVGYDDRYTILEALLATNGPLWPLLRTLGYVTVHQWNDGSTALARCDLSHYGITGPLADACIAAAGAKP